MPKISILILLFEIYFHMALPTHLEEYNSIFISLIELLNQNNDTLSNTINSSNNSLSVKDSILLLDRANETENITHYYNNLSYSLIEEVISDTNKTMTTILKGEISNINLLTSLRLSTDVILKNILLFSSLLSLIIGTVLGLTQIKLKRLLAYSTISHVGFLLLCLAIKTEISIESFIFYLIQYSLTNLNGFLILLAFGLSMNYLIDYKGCFACPKIYHESLSNMLKNMINTYNPLRALKNNSYLDKFSYKFKEGKENSKDPHKINSLRFMSDLNLTLDNKIDNLTPLSLNYDTLNNIKLRTAAQLAGEYKTKGTDLLFIKELKDQFKFNPALSLSFAVTLFSMAGIYKIIL
jgi:hypothetical protein